MEYGQYDVENAIDCVNFGVGQPQSKYLPIDEVCNAFAQLSICRNNPAMLQYGNIKGYEKFRTDFSLYLSQTYSSVVNSNELIMTEGITGAISILLDCFKKDYKYVLCEDPTYFIMLKIFEEAELKIIPIKIQHDGININELEEKLISLDGEKCLLYTVPIYHNPTGYTMSEEKRYKLGLLVDKYPNLQVIADEVYHMLGYSDIMEHKPLYFTNNKIISVGSFSKIFAPAMRLGWIHTNEKLCDKISNISRLNSGGNNVVLNCCLMHKLLLDGNLVNVNNKWKRILKKNSDFLYIYVVKYLTPFIKSIYKPAGGYFLWIEMKDGISCSKLSEKMEKYKVKFHHGNKFSASLSCDNFMRLSVSWYENEDLKLGILRLKELLSNETSINSLLDVYVLGHQGKLGSKIVNELNKTDNMKFIEGITRDYDYDNIKDNSVIVDVSSPDGTRKLFEQLLEKEKRVNVIIGTTGNLPIQLIREYIKFSGTIVKVYSNFSLGITELHKMIDVIDKEKWIASIYECHHIHKKDGPSGTALMIRDWYGIVNDVSYKRIGEVIGDHTLRLESDDESIIITHHAKSRDLFAKGCIHWINKLIQ